MADDDSDQRELVDQYFAAMRRGAVAEQDLLALFTDDAIYDEPFSGLNTPARGRDEVRTRLSSGWQTPLPDLRLDVISVTIEGSTATSRWECRSSAFPAPVRGTDHYVFVGGKIAQLRVTIDD